MTIVDTALPEGRVLEQGKSAELSACLQLIQETTVDDVEKYSAKTCRELARAIVCRTYAPAIHELCHLVVIAAHLGAPDRRYESLFWDSGPARPRGFRDFLEQRHTGNPAFDMVGGEVAIAYADKPFAVTYGRMPLLSALLEFLMTALGYIPLDEALTPLLGEMPTAAQVSDAANELSKQAYGYLQAHLPAVQEQRKNRSFLAFAAARAADGLSLEAVTDENVLAYWLAHSRDDDSEGAATDARTYRGVFRTAAHLIRILRHAEEKYHLDGALPIGADRDSGEIDPAELEQALAEIDDRDTALSEVAAGVGVKFLNRREIESLEQALFGDDVGGALTRSILRNAVFGDAQARLIQATRGKPSAEALQEKILAEPDDDYQARLADYISLGEHLERVMFAALHVLGLARHRAAVDAVLALRPDLDLGTLDDAEEPNWGDGNVVSFRAKSALDGFFHRLMTENATDADDLAGLAANARAAHKGIARQGFADEVAGDSAIVEVFAEAIAPLARLRRELAAFLEKHADAIDWDDEIKTDTPTFRDQFLLLYGGQDG